MEQYTLSKIPFSKKNNKQIITNRKNNRPIIISSEKYLCWEKEAVKELAIQKIQYIGGSISKCDGVRITFYIKHKYRKDLTNIAEGVMDSLVKALILDDDNMFVVPKLTLEYIESQEPRVDICIY